LMVPWLGDLRSGQIGVLIGSLMILMIAIVTVSWLRASSRQELLCVGLLWVALMLSFEVALGRVLGLSWDRIVSDYDPRRGGLMIFGMLVLAAAPTIASAIRQRAARR